MKRLRVDASSCVGHGRCYRIAPSSFRPKDATGHAEVIDVDESTRADDDLSRAVESCPEMAIEWVDE
jgi:ferredoxin